MKRKHYLTAIAVLSATAIGSAYAAKSAENDAFAVESAQIGLSQAVTAAEQHAGGKASRAEYEKSKGRWVFDVEVVAGKKVLDIKVDATTGTVLAMTDDKADTDDEHDAED
jgi:uncharacterized membrane protein YkoI